MGAQTHQSDPRTLGRRTLERDHRALAALLRPGMSVLDVGCGTGAITAGIAKAVGPEGSVAGVDRDEGLLEIARREHRDGNLTFTRGDATRLDFQAQFDVVTAARTLQWIADPALAIAKMKHATRLSGRVVVLDYSHAFNAWEPEPPPAFVRFYGAFLEWRESNGWDNQMADHLPELFRSAGLAEVESHVQDEVSQRGEPLFDEETAIWADVLEKIGAQIVAAGFITEAELRDAAEGYRPWTRTALIKQTLVLRTVVGRAG